MEEPWKWYTNYIMAIYCELMGLGGWEIWKDVNLYEDTGIG